MDAGYEIYEYSRKGALADLREALDSGIRADEYQAYDGSTALVMAARCGHPHIVRELLDRGANLGVHTDDGSSVLSHAVSGGDCDVVSMVLGEGAVVDEANEDGVTPLMLAAHYGWCDILEKLCDAGADLTLSANGWGTALDGAEGDAAAYLEKRGATRSRGARTNLWLQALSVSCTAASKVVRSTAARLQSDQWWGRASVWRGRSRAPSSWVRWASSWMMMAQVACR